VYHKDLTNVKLPITCDPSMPGKSNSSLMTSYQGIGLGGQKQSFGLLRSPDLHQLDFFFFFWWYIKEHVYIPSSPSTVRTVNEQ
jgi:hypothetical protein